MCWYHTHDLGSHLIIVNQYAYYEKGSTIHSVKQLSHFGLDLDDQSSVIPLHQQHMMTPDQWIISFNIINGLTRMPMQPSTDEDLDRLPHHIVSSDDVWDPTVLDHSINIENDTYYPTRDPTIDEEEFSSLDECTSMTGIYLHHDSCHSDYVCDVYHNKCMNCSGFDLKTTDNFYHLSLQSMIKDQD